MKNFVCNIIVNNRELSVVYDKLTNGVYCHYEHYSMTDEDMMNDMRVYFDEFYSIIFDRAYDPSLSILRKPDNFYILNIAQVQDRNCLSDEIINEQLKLFKPYIERWVEEQLSKPSDSMKPVTTQLFWKHGRELTEEDKVKIAEVLEQ